MLHFYRSLLFEGDWIYQIYQYTSHSLQDHLEVRTNKPVVTRLKNHMCSLLHIWILLRQPTTWMIDKYNCTYLSHWQIQLHTLDKYNSTHLTNTIAHTWQILLHTLGKYNCTFDKCSCVHLSDWHKTSNQLLLDFQPLKIHLWRQLACAHLNESNYKAAGRLSSRMITTARPRMDEKLHLPYFLVFTGYRNDDQTYLQ